MMFMQNSIIIQGLIISNALLLAAATIAVLRLQNYINKSAEFWDSPTGAALKSDSGGKADSVAQVEKRLRNLQEKVDDLTRRQPTSHTTVVQDRPIENAVRMARDGACLDDLRRSCGLNRGEAQLLMKLHAAKSANVVCDG